ncbi:thiopeptide-type bacteriocin biosynthesis protein [Flavihumibacter stibioxidans]|uniref:Thiopeptide-type bacteriocin biosynthesis domain-containing protein n=1 Tax=Flavihumibacter stibioxidans TaxID=1834163 RepID=A0ABR7M9K1_9BACT|nr:lantibiotic dehydratase [Flavihumibacter stibioxidans]MBC6491705.1 hypothetical protein [Flavihumibacter stibioxidans]
MVSQIKQVFPDASKGKDLFYAIAERHIHIGGLCLSYQDAIQKGLRSLSSLLPEVRNTALEMFKSSFKQRFGDNEIPLLEALDPEKGIDYCGLAETNSSLRLNHYEKKLRVNKDPSRNAHWHKVQQLLVKKLLQMEANNKKQIIITDNDLNQLESVKGDSINAPSIAVMFRTLKDRVVIENIGGASALSLLGRFTGVNSSFDEQVRSMAAKEQALNPDILFAEIAHLGESKFANINRREQVRDFEIPVLTSSIAQSHYQVQLNDLMISVVNERIVLRSKRLNKEIVPRLSSAFNYTKSSLPIYRFLCDAQGQGLRMGGAFNLSHYLAGLSFYPRVVYKTAILQLAEWHLMDSDLEVFKDKSDNHLFASFSQFAKSEGMPRYIALIRGDNYLVFDRFKRDDVLLLLSELRTEEKCILQEFPYLNDGMNVRDNYGKTYLPQWIAALYNTESVYKGLSHTPSFFSQPANPIGYDWIYFKVYVHPLNANQILVNHIFPAMDKLKTIRAIRKWHFLRYKDPGDHLRIRVLYCNRMEAKVYEMFHTIFLDLLKQNQIYSFQSDIYHRETLRYGTGNIVRVEDIFHGSSLIVKDFLKQWIRQGQHPGYIYGFAVRTAEICLSNAGWNDGKKVQFCNDMFNVFFKEFGSSRDLKTLLAKEYKLYKNYFHEVVDGECSRTTLFQPDIDAFIRPVRDLVTRMIMKDIAIEKIIADLLHMHFNRIFNEDQRKYEMICYYFLYRTLSMRQHINQVDNTTIEALSSIT